MKLIAWIMFSLCLTIRCCGLTAAIAGPRESVAVAVAVDKLLQTSTPALPDDLDNGREANPMPPPTAVCPCGCGRVGCTCPHAQGIAAVGASPCRVADVGPVLSIDEAALDSLAPRKRQVIVYVSDPAAGDGRCIPCERTAAALGSGDDSISVIVLPRTKSGRRLSGMPTIHVPDCDQWWVGYMDLPTLKRFLAQYPAPQSIGAVNIGSIKGRAQLAKVFDNVQQSSAGATIKVGSASVVIPPKMVAEFALTRDGLRVAFTGAKPSVKVGNGWLSLGRAVSSLEVSRDRVGVGIDGCPDLSLTVDD